MIMAMSRAYNPVFSMSSDFFYCDFANEIKRAVAKIAHKTRIRFLRYAIMSVLGRPTFFDIDGELIMKEERDSQCAKLYRADDVLKGFALPLVTVSDVEKYIKKVWGSKRIQKAFPRALRWNAPTVKDGRGTRIARGGWGYVSIPLWARTSDVVLHELAHTITIREHGSHTAAHGWKYCSVFLTLTRYMMGPAAHTAFKASMKKHRVKYKAPRQRKLMTDEQRSILVARMAFARTQRKAT